MTSLFDNPADRPLAEQLRPTALEEVVGQNHLLAPNAPLGRMLAAGRLASVILWALAHLPSSGHLGASLVFSAFLAWAVADFLSARRRDRDTGQRYASGTVLGNAISLGAGLLAWALLAGPLHAKILGPALFGL